MDLSNVKSYQRTIASVNVPIMHFIETGFWNPQSLPGWEPNDISEQQVRGACRKIAKELKRPFIECYAHFTRHKWEPSGKFYSSGAPEYRWVKLDEPVFSHGAVRMPQQKRLAPMMAALSLLPPQPGNRNGRYGYDDKTPGYSHHMATLWQWHINDQSLWNQLYDFLLNDPDCRKARQLTS